MSTAHLATTERLGSNSQGTIARLVHHNTDEQGTLLATGNNNPLPTNPGALSSGTDSVTASIQASATVTGVGVYRNSALSSTVQAVKATAGRLYGYNIANPNASVVYVQVFDLASGSVTVGTTLPLLSIAIPASGVLDQALTIPVQFASAIATAVTTTPTGNTAPGTAVPVNLLFV